MHATRALCACVHGRRNFPASESAPNSDYCNRVRVHVYNIRFYLPQPLTNCSETDIVTSEKSTPSLSKIPPDFCADVRFSISESRCEFQVGHELLAVDDNVDRYSRRFAIAAQECSGTESHRLVKKHNIISVEHIDLHVVSL